MPKNKKNSSIESSSRSSIKNIAGLTVFLLAGAFLISGVFTLLLFSIK